MPAISLHVQHGKMRQRVVRHPPIPHQPAAELLDRPEVMVAGLDAQAASPQVGQITLRAARRDVADESPLAASHDFSNLGGHFADVLLAVSLAPLVLFEFFDVFRQRPLHVVIERIDSARRPAFSLDDSSVEHRLGRALVGRQRHPLLDAMLVAVASPPLLRVHRDLLAGLRIASLDRLLVQTCHRSQISKTPPTPGGTGVTVCSFPREPQVNSGRVANPSADTR
ncbi:MAG: hypothetical protein AB7O59_11150 [Pirellulales bacterium]